MGVQAIMRCDTKTEYASAGWKPNPVPSWYTDEEGVVNVEVKMQAAYDVDLDLNDYAAATPSASLNMTIQNPAAARFFKPGKMYKIQITELQERDL